MSQPLRLKILSCVDQITGDLGVEAGKVKLGFMFGYYAANTMSVAGADDESFLTLFSRQWAGLESKLCAINEIRPVDIDLAKDLAATVFTARCRSAAGGFGNLFLTNRELKSLDVDYMVKVVLKDAVVSVEDMTLFYGMMK